MSTKAKKVDTIQTEGKKMHKLNLYSSTQDTAEP